MEFSEGTGEDFQKHVKSLLSELSCNEHEKYLKYLAGKKQQSANTTNAVTSTVNTSAPPAISPKEEPTNTAAIDKTE